MLKCTIYKTQTYEIELAADDEVAVREYIAAHGGSFYHAIRETIIRRPHIMDYAELVYEDDDITAVENNKDCNGSCSNCNNKCDGYYEMFNEVK